MAETFLISDTHFGHAGMCRFTRHDGSKVRPWNDPSEMDEALVAAWNAVVQPGDKVYHLGDVAMARKHIATLGRCNGTKVLIKGNHDLFNLADYAPYFKDIRGSHVLEGRLLTHIPVHPASLDRWGANIHGHLHSESVLGIDGTPDRRYVCVSVEQTGFAPVALDTVLEQINRLAQKFSNV
jgi:calcineurin-like phosphoesterase family protein